MDDEGPYKSVEFHPPTIDDLIKWCKSLNEQDVKYIVVGGMAMIQVGLSRATVDINLLIVLQEMWRK